MERNGRGRIAWGDYLIVTILLCATIFSFVTFAKENQRRILWQNQRYARDAAIQAADRVEDMLEARSTTLNLLSITVAETIKEPWIETDFLKLLQETSVFDYVEFIDVDGLNHNAEGQTSDSTDRNNYLKGIQGETGFHVIFNSRITKETLVNFYAPVRYQGEIIGVLNGMFREESLRKAISVESFGEDVKSLICMKDGTVISAYGYGSPVENLSEALIQDGVSPKESLGEIWDAFEARDAFYGGVQGKSEDVSVSLVPVGVDWMLVQTFPSAVTRQMAADVNSAGMKLELHLIILFLVYVAYLIITNLRKRRQLTSEKARLGGIVEGLVPLFARLVIIEPEGESYEYLKGAPPQLPVKGNLCEENEDSSATLPSLEEIGAALSEEMPYFQYEYRIRWEEERWENVSVLSLQQKDGVPVSLIFVIQDVTALRRRKDAIEQTLQDAFHTAEDLRLAKSDFLARMSHDMRTPMNAVLGMTSIALSHLDDSAQVKDCLEKIGASGQRLLTLINEVLDMSKIESGGMVLDETGFDPEEEIGRVLDEARAVAMKKDLQLNAYITSFDHRDVLGDPERLKQVLRNLLDNAVKYTPAGGTVTFRARELPSRALKSGYYEFVVEDTGVGIEPAFLPKIFEPFVRWESSPGDLGTGLGLPIVQTIVKLMSGEVKVESEPGRGSTFTVHVFFKLAEEESQYPSKPKESGQTDMADAERTESAESQESEDKSMMRHEGIRVLLVEDIAMNMLVARKMLTKAGILVETAEDGWEAVKLVKAKPPGYYDLIFMDLQMPVMDGFEATRAIRDLGREDLAQIPIVAVTANGFQEDVSRAWDAGMNDLVLKPVNLDRLLEALDKWLPKESLPSENISNPVSDEQE